MKIRTLEPRYSRKVRNDKDLLLKGRQKKYCWFWKCQMPMPYFLIFKILSSFWCRVDLQCRISSKCTEKLIHLYIYVYSLFEILFSCRLSQNIRQSSMCYAVGLCYLSILCVAGHMCSLRTPDLSLPSAFPLQWQCLILLSVSRFLFYKLICIFFH